MAHVEANSDPEYPIKLVVRSWEGFISEELTKKDAFELMQSLQGALYEYDQCVSD